MVGGLKGTSYEEKLSELGLQSLEARRAEADMIMVYKVLTGKVRIARDSWFQMAKAGAATHKGSSRPPAAPETSCEAGHKRKVFHSESD